MSSRGFVPHIQYPGHLSLINIPYSWRVVCILYSSTVLEYSREYAYAYAYAYILSRVWIKLYHTSVEPCRLFSAAKHWLAWHQHVVAQCQILFSRKLALNLTSKKTRKDPFFSLNRQRKPNLKYIKPIQSLVFLLLL